MIMCACIQNRTTVKMLKSLIIVRALKWRNLSQRLSSAVKERSDNGRVSDRIRGKYRARESFIRKVCISRVRMLQTGSVSSNYASAGRKESLTQFNYPGFKNAILEHVWLNHQIQGMGRVGLKSI